MGVPAFYRWLSEKYPKIVAEMLEKRAGYVDGVEIPLDLTEPNPNGIEYDNLYVDMNGLIHPCSHPEDREAPSTEAEMYLNVTKYIDRLFNAVRPRKILFLAIDGVAPRAKMNQQRSRRFRAAQDAKDRQKMMDEVLADIEELGLFAEQNNKGGANWDSNVITPGTEFMYNLSIYIRFYILDRMNKFKAWRDIKVILSDANEPGEGEHKIMKFIRSQRAQPGYSPNQHHILHGLDADLIMLALATHEPHFTILRELVTFGKKERDAKPSQAQQLLNSQACAINPQDEWVYSKPLQVLHINILREYLAVEFQCLKHQQVMPFPYDFERVIDDFVFLCFFVGNDFLPHLPSLDIRDGAIDFLMDVYKQILPSLGNYLTDPGGCVNLSQVDIILSKVGEIEDVIFQKRKAAEDKRNQRENSNRRNDSLSKSNQQSGFNNQVQNHNQNPTQHSIISSTRLKQLQTPSTTMTKAVSGGNTNYPPPTNGQPFATPIGLSSVESGFTQPIPASRAQAQGNSQLSSTVPYPGGTISQPRGSVSSPVRTGSGVQQTLPYSQLTNAPLPPSIPLHPQKVNIPVTTQLSTTTAWAHSVPQAYQPKKLDIKIIPLAANKDAAKTLREKILGKRSTSSNDTRPPASQPFQPPAIDSSLSNRCQVSEGQSALVATVESKEGEYNAPSRSTDSNTHFQLPTHTADSNVLPDNKATKKARLDNIQEKSQQINCCQSIPSNTPNHPDAKFTTEDALQMQQSIPQTRDNNLPAPINEDVGGDLDVDFLDNIMDDDDEDPFALLPDLHRMLSSPSIPDVIVTTQNGHCKEVTNALISGVDINDGKVAVKVLTKDQLKDRLKQKENELLDKYRESTLDNIRLHEEGWKARYYDDPPKQENLKQGGGLKRMCQTYVEGLSWVLKYYYEGCPSWNWYYPFHYAPFASDLVNIDQFTIKFDLSEPFHPIEQLLAVLPSDSSHALPPSCRWLMTEENSPIHDLYISDIPIDPNGKHLPWLWILLLPFIDEKRIMKAFQLCKDKLTLHEIKRNSFSGSFIFVHSKHELSLYLSIQPNFIYKADVERNAEVLEYLRKQNNDFLQIDLPLQITESDKTSAEFAVSQLGTDIQAQEFIYFGSNPGNGVCGAVANAPLSWYAPLYHQISCPKLPLNAFIDIKSNQVLCLSFVFPNESAYVSRLLPGYIPQPAVLEAYDLMPRRPPRMNKGFNMMDIAQQNNVGLGQPRTFNQAQYQQTNFPHLPNNKRRDLRGQVDYNSHDSSSYRQFQYGNSNHETTSHYQNHHHPQSNRNNRIPGEQYERGLQATHNMVSNYLGGQVRPSHKHPRSSDIEFSLPQSQSIHVPAHTGGKGYGSQPQSNRYEREGYYRDPRNQSFNRHQQPQHDHRTGNGAPSNQRYNQLQQMHQHNGHYSEERNYEYNLHGSTSFPPSQQISRDYRDFGQYQHPVHHNVDRVITAGRESVGHGRGYVGYGQSEGGKGGYGFTHSIYDQSVSDAVKLEQPLPRGSPASGPVLKQLGMSGTQALASHAHGVQAPYSFLNRSIPGPGGFQGQDHPTGTNIDSSNLLRPVTSMQAMRQQFTQSQIQPQQYLIPNPSVALTPDQVRGYGTGPGLSHGDQSRSRSSRGRDAASYPPSKR